MSETIYMPLLDEDISVWRPVAAHRIAANTYIVLRPADYDQDNERWAFPPGSIVTTADRSLSGEIVPAAVALSPDVRQIA